MRYKVKAPTLHMRVAPSIDATVRSDLHAGQYIEISERAPVATWGHVVMIYNDKGNLQTDGWVALEFCEQVSNDPSPVSSTGYDDGFKAGYTRAINEMFAFLSNMNGQKK